MNFLILFAGLVALVKSADWLVDGASALAKRVGVSPLLVGLTIVSVGTSLPELMVNVISAANGSTGLALGNVVGSNLANTLLILGMAALIYPPKMALSTVWKEIPFSLLAALVVLVLVSDRGIDGAEFNLLTRSDGLVLLSFLAIFLYYLANMALKPKEVGEEAIETHLPLSRAMFLVVAGCVGLYFGGDWTVKGATAIAVTLGMSDFLISATIVAIGTSLPELVTCVRASSRKEGELAVGNVVGSNIFNIFGILGITSLIRPIALPPGALIDLVFLAAMSVVLFVTMFLGTRHRLGRVEGGLFVALYFGYLGYMILRS